MKDDLLEITRAHLVRLSAIQKSVRTYSGARIQERGLLSTVQSVAASWFDVVRPPLQAASFPPVTIQKMSASFEQLLTLSRSRPRKSVLLTAITECLVPYKDELIHQIEIGSFSSAASLSIAPYIEGLSEDEGEYLSEAQRCLTVNALRGCIVLGWCAAVARIHTKIGELGFDTFSKATAEMSAKNTGRFKPFKKRHDVETLSELQRVFDTDILWVLEYMELIDGNQHQRLRHCFEFRNNSAHPGLAPIKGENLYSFYSDISEIVLKNPKFEI